MSEKLKCPECNAKLEIQKDVSSGSGSYTNKELLDRAYERMKSEYTSPSSSQTGLEYPVKAEICTCCICPESKETSSSRGFTEKFPYYIDRCPTHR